MSMASLCKSVSWPSESLEQRMYRGSTAPVDNGLSPAGSIGFEPRGVQCLKSRPSSMIQMQGLWAAK